MNTIRKILPSKKVPDEPTGSTMMKPISYYIKGSFKITGPTKIKNDHLSTLCLLTIAEAFIKRTYPCSVVNAIYIDLYQATKLNQLRAKNASDCLSYWESHIEVKRFINIPCVPVSTELFNKRTNHNLRFLTEEEEIIQVEFNFFIATGDNSFMIMDCLLRQGYSKRQLRGLKIHPLLERLITSEHIQLNYNFPELARQVSLAVAGKTGSRLQIEWTK